IPPAKISRENAVMLAIFGWKSNEAVPWPRLPDRFLFVPHVRRQGRGGTSSQEGVSDEQGPDDPGRLQCAEGRAALASAGGASAHHRCDRGSPRARGLVRKCRVPCGQGGAEP